MIHGSWCNAKTYKLRCKYCGKMIYYFSCDCGSKVFFDELGFPWPIHNCIEFRQAKQKELFLTALKTLNLNDLFFQGVKCEIDDDYSEQLFRHKLKIKEEFHTVRANPELITINEIGYLRELTTSVDLFKIFKEEKTEINLQTLKGLKKLNLSKITINSGDLHKGDIQSYTGYIDKNLIKGIKKGDLLEFQVQGKKIFFQEIIWFFNWIDTVDFNIDKCNVE